LKLKTKPRKSIHVNDVDKFRLSKPIEELEPHPNLTNPLVC
jgi:hypothetical protein